MDKPWLYEIRVEGQLTEYWSVWFEGLAIRYNSDEETSLTSQLADQAALFGVLSRIRDLNLVLVSVRRIQSGTA